MKTERSPTASEQALLAEVGGKNAVRMMSEEAGTATEEGVVHHRLGSNLGSDPRTVMDDDLAASWIWSLTYAGTARVPGWGVRLVAMTRIEKGGSRNAARERAAMPGCGGSCARERWISDHSGARMRQKQPGRRRPPSRIAAKKQSELTLTGICTRLKSSLRALTAAKVRHRCAYVTLATDLVSPR